MAYQSTYNPCLLQEKVAVITGGGSGIGRCVAHELASLGARVIITGRSADKLEAVTKEILEDGGDCDWVAFDIRDEDSVTNAIDGIVSQSITFAIANKSVIFRIVHIKAAVRGAKPQIAGLVLNDFLNRIVA